LAVSGKVPIFVAGLAESPIIAIVTMSEEKRKNLANILSSLSNEDKVWVINYLVQGIFSLPQKRKARKIHKDELTDEQWEDYFDHQPVVPLPEETIPLKEMLAATSGRTIKQMEKWL